MSISSDVSLPANLGMLGLGKFLAAGDDGCVRPGEVPAGFFEMSYFARQTPAFGGVSP